MENKGFTLLELVVVICLLGVIAALGAPSFAGIIQSAGKKQCDKNIEIMSAVYEAEKDRIPDVDLNDIVNNTDGLYFAEKFTCGGKSYRITEKDNYYEIVCPLHGGIVVDEIPDNMIYNMKAAMDAFLSAKISSHSDFEKFMLGQNPSMPFEPTEEQQRLMEQLGIKSSGNDALRKYLYIYLYNGNWPTLEEGLYIKPYIWNGQNGDKNNVVIYADSSSGVNSNWNVQYIYNKDDGNWYHKKDNRGYIISNKSWETIKTDLLNTSMFEIYDNK